MSRTFYYKGIQLPQLRGFCAVAVEGSYAAGQAFPHRERVYNFYRRGFTAALNDLWQRDRKGNFRHGH